MSLRTRIVLLVAAMLLSVGILGATPALAASQTFTIPERSCTANTECDSAGVAWPANVTQVTVSLTSSQWTNPVLAGADVLWGIAYSTDGGVTWGPGTCSTSSNLIGGVTTSIPAWAYQTDIVGRFGRNGAIGQFGFSSVNQPPAGALVRLFSFSTVTLPLGVTITVS